MFKRKTIRVKLPPNGFTDHHGSGAVGDPWKKIEQLTESRDRMRDALDVLHAQLEECHRKEILAYLAQHGVETRDDPIKNVPTFEHGGATFLALPEGWSWHHSLEGRSLSDRYLPGCVSVLRIYTPNEATIATVTSSDRSVDHDKPFKNSDMLLACINALRKVLPEPEWSQTPVLGVIPRGAQ